jgi:DNA polymerase-1
MKRLVIIDGKSILYRGYYAMGNLSTRDGVPTGGVYGFASILLEVVAKLSPDYVAVAWDKPHTNIRRRLAIYSEYKAGRAKAPADFYAQVPILMDLLDAFHIPFYEADDFEADDIMGTLSTKANQAGVETYLISGDLDMLQLVDHDTKFYALKTGFSRVDEFDLAAFRDKYGIDKSQFLDLKALKGDSSDNIPGVPGVGEKTATQLLQKYQTLDNVYAHLDEIPGALHDKLANGKASAYMSRELSQIMLDAPVDFDPTAADISQADPAKVLSILQHLEFRSLITKAQKLFGVTAPAEEARSQSAIKLAGKANSQGASHLSEPAEISPLSPDVAPPTKAGLSRTARTSLGEQPANSLTPAVIEFDLKSAMHADPALAAEVLDGARFWDLNQAAFLLNQPAPEGADKQAIYDTQALAFAELPKLRNLYEDFDLPLIPILYQMETAGIEIDLDYFRQLDQNITAKVQDLTKQVSTLAGQEFNLNSPAQLSEILFNRLGLPTTGIKKRRRFFSTDARTLEKLHGQHPIITLIEQYREVSKLKSTYIDALPPLADANHRIHTTFTQDVTATGRLSSLNPNLQNIPVRTDLGREIRTGFIAGQGKTFVSADYSQFELRLAAVLAGDQLLIDDFNAGIDIHTKTAAGVFGVPMEQVTKDQRRAAKVVNFGVLYGMSPKGLSDATGMPVYEAKTFIDKYFALRAPIRRYLDLTLEQAKSLGYVETYYGRRRYTPDVNSPNFLIRQSATRAAQNMPIQGTEADLMKRAMIQLDAQLQSQLPDAQLLLQIHDSLVVLCDPATAPAVEALMRRIMEAVAPELPIKLAVDVTTGSNWGEL